MGFMVVSWDFYRQSMGFMVVEVFFFRGRARVFGWLTMVIVTVLVGFLIGRPWNFRWLMAKPIGESMVAYG